MVIYASRGYSGPMGVTLQSHNTLCDCKVTNLYNTEWIQHAGETSLNTCTWSIVNNGIDNPYNAEWIQHADGQ